jgi:hypothetical protein
LFHSHFDLALPSNPKVQASRFCRGGIWPEQSEKSNLWDLRFMNAQLRIMMESLQWREKDNHGHPNEIDAFCRKEGGYFAMSFIIHSVFIGKQSVTFRNTSLMHTLKVF